MSLAMDNFRVDVTAWRGHLKDRNLLAEVMAVAFVGITAVAYRVEPAAFERVSEPRQPPQVLRPARLIFYWTIAELTTPTPFKLDSVAAADWAERWLAEIQYPREPDHDGDNSKGWRVYNRGVGADTADYLPYHAMCAVEPAWAEHGK